MMKIDFTSTLFIGTVLVFYLVSMPAVYSFTNSFTSRPPLNVQLVDPECPSGTCPTHAGRSLHAIVGALLVVAICKSIK